MIGAGNHGKSSAWAARAARSCRRTGATPKNAVYTSSGVLGECRANPESAFRITSGPHSDYCETIDSSDNVPEPVYIAMSKQFGECPREMKRAYREGFNNSFNPIDVICVAWWAAMSEPARRNVMFRAETTDIAKAWAWHKLAQIEDAGDN